MIEREPRFDPLPAFGSILADRRRVRFELLDGEPVQQRGVGQKPALLVVEQVASHDAPGGLVGVDAHEAHQGAGGRLDLAGRELAADGSRVAVPGLGIEPRALLRGVVVAQRQGHELVEIDALLPVQRQQPWRQRRQLESPLHGQRRHAEPCRHVLDSLALVDHRLEGVELVGRVQRLAPAVLGDADFQRPLGRHQFAQHLVRLGKAALALQQQHRAAPPLARRDLEAQFSGLARPVISSARALGHDQRVQQALRRNQRRQRLHVALRVPAHIAR